MNATLYNRRAAGVIGGENYEHKYLTFKPYDDTTFSFKLKGTGNDIEYSIDGGSWTSLASEAVSPTVSAGHEIRWRATLAPVSNAGIGKFMPIEKNYEVYGNPLSLLYGDNFINQTVLPGNYSLLQLFQNCTTLTSAANLKFVVTDLTNKSNCYKEMFYGCSSLITPPDTLGATTLSAFCYQSMFEKCSSMTTAPILPAMTIADRSYIAMFRDCTSLTIAPGLPATSISQQCYRNMFLGCTALTTVPSELPAMTLKTYCYQSMFNGCKLITTSPVLPALTLAEQSYGNMFSGCKALNYITMLATDISANNCLQYWVNNVSSTGTFVKNASMSTLPSGSHGIPNNWTVVDYVSN